MAAEMTGLEKFRLAVKVSTLIDRNLETLARVVEGTDNRNSAYNTVVSDLKALFPGDDIETLANAVITDRCRAEYLKMMYSKRPIGSGGRD